jgi:hypothetical protein
MRCNPYFAIALTLSVVLATGADARPKGPPPGGGGGATITAAPVALMITGFDRDGDLRVTRAEYDAGVKQSFDSIAQGRDKLSPIDFDHWGERWLGNSGALPGRMDFDTDGDERVSWTEFMTCFAQIFQGYDADGDGVITRAELLSVGAPRFQGGGDRPAGGRGPGGGRGGMGGGMRGGGMGGMGGMGGGAGDEDPPS